MRANFIYFLFGLFLCLASSVSAQTTLPKGEEAGKYVYFASGSAVLSAEGKKTIDGVLASAPAGKKIAVMVFGHTDDVGQDDKNIELSRKRCYAVWDYAMEKRGMDVAKGDITMSGEYLPKVLNDNDKNRATNRRVGITVKVMD